MQHKNYRPFLFKIKERTLCLNNKNTVREMDALLNPFFVVVFLNVYKTLRNQSSQ